MALSTPSDGSIVVDRLWKRFRKDQVRPFLSDQVRALLHGGRGEDRYRWVLRDLDFSIEPGESVAVVGSNGAGKSTLLKLLCRVTYPYAGSVSIHGRVGAIIELRGGMHPELTGRENTFLYGALLGLSNQEIAGRFDTIVDFADLSSAIDRQMKYYSSGMQMRLGFAIAAFLRPHVLLVDEVLAVGDAWFQQRCLDRMREVLQEGTTLVLVSHDLASVEAICRRGLWLDGGLLVADGPIREVLSSYRHTVEDRVTSSYIAPDSVLTLDSVDISGPDGGMVLGHHDLTVRTVLTVTEPRRGRLHLGITEGGASPIFLVSTSVDLQVGTTEIWCTMSNVPLARGHYSLWMHIERGNDEDLLPWHPVSSFVAAGSDLDPAPTGVVRLAPVHVAATWERTHTG